MACMQLVASDVPTEGSMAVLVATVVSPKQTQPWQGSHGWQGSPRKKKHGSRGELAAAAKPPPWQQLMPGWKHSLAMHTTMYLDNCDASNRYSWCTSQHCCGQPSALLPSIPAPHLCTRHHHLLATNVAAQQLLRIADICGWGKGGGPGVTSVVVWK